MLSDQMSASRRPVWVHVKLFVSCRPPGLIEHMLQSLLMHAGMTDFANPTKTNTKDCLISVYFTQFCMHTNA